MKVVGYITVFCFLIWSAYFVSSGAQQGNVGLALFFGMLIPIIMAFIADINGDMD